MAARQPLARSLAVRLIEARARKPFGEIIGARRQKGKTFRQIGAEFGVSGQTVWRYWRDQESRGRDASTSTR